VETRWNNISLPDKPWVTNIGAEPGAFARGLMNAVNQRHGRPARLERYLLGAARTITERMPAELWPIFRQVAARAKGPPTVLLLSDEPYVPWELAFVEDPLVDPAAPPFLAAQAVVGRWPIRSTQMPPPEKLSVAKVAVVSGVYQKPGWRRLEAAEHEAAFLVGERFGPAVATAVDAAPDPILSCLDGTPAADLLHFAVHGSFDPNGAANGIVLVDGSYLDPMEVRGTKLSRRPMVFLNACQIGQGQAVLGDYAGMAEAFLAAGASAVIAPLWSINDQLAKDAALAFYRGSDRMKPAEALRRGRTGPVAAERPPPAIALAYQFFGHPGLRVRLPIQPRNTPP
jgi:hypothetical protein